MLRQRGSPGSDAAIAERVANRCGVPHRLLLSYDGDLDDVIERNARLGDGSANFCDEALVWDTLVAEHAAHRPPMFLGDTVLVDYTAETVDFLDVLHVCGMRDFAGLAWIRGLLPTGQYVDLRDAQAADLADMERLMLEMGDLLDTRYFLFLDQRICHVHLPWRENFAARGFAVQEPLLDNEVLDFSRRLPPDIRRYQQRLYRAAVALLAPEVFTDPTAAVTGCVIDWRGQLHGQAASLIGPPKYGGSSGGPAHRRWTPSSIPALSRGSSGYRAWGPLMTAIGGCLSHGAGCAGNGAGSGARSPAVSSPCRRLRPTSSDATWCCGASSRSPGRTLF